jgi:two-component system cell cycle response regulator
MDMAEVLLVGEPGRVFSDAKALSWRVCADTLGGIEAAAKTRFDVVAVEMNASAARMRPVLATLRKRSQGARVILVAQMYDEPAAMGLVADRSDGTGLADDYLVCPLSAKQFCDQVAGRNRLFQAESGGGKTPDAALQARISHLEKLATEDDLTRLKNRRYLWEFAGQIIERAKNDHGRVTLLIFDIDNFKHYNDQYGHSAGDEVLKQAAVMMKRCCRKHDVVARVGGDEFAVVFWDDPKCPMTADKEERRTSSADHPKEVLAIARRFRKEVENADLHLLGREGRGVLTISGGLAGLGRDGWSAEELFNQADGALLDAKRSGKNRIYLVGHPENDIDKID